MNRVHILGLILPDVHLLAPSSLPINGPAVRYHPAWLNTGLVPSRTPGDDA